MSKGKKYSGIIRKSGLDYELDLEIEFGSRDALFNVVVMSYVRLSRN